MAFRLLTHASWRGLHCAFLFCRIEARVAVPNQGWKELNLLQCLRFSYE